MLRTLLAVPLAAAAALAPPARAGPLEPAEGRLDTGTAQVEILGRPVRVGERIELPEGYLVVEEQGTEDGQVGSFSVVPAEAFATPPTALAMAEPAEAPPDGLRARPLPDAPARAAPAAADCRAERAAYLRELWSTSGIDVKDPGALLAGLEAGEAGPASGYYWFALATDPFRPLAWSSDLRARAEALARCVRGN